uniref:Uncharacterized protein n=1 Tax=Anguilla anguilla TaxID=7936 RepID=A0A0E9UQT3_ANGAN
MWPFKEGSGRKRHTQVGLYCATTVFYFSKENFVLFNCIFLEDIFFPRGKC